MTEIKRMNIKEFRELGYLQEANRQFFHPLGIALEIVYDNPGKVKRFFGKLFNIEKWKSETWSLGGIWDSREDPEGYYFDIKNRDEENVSKMIEKSKYIENELMKRSEVRKKLFGSIVEPVFLKDEV